MFIQGETGNDRAGEAEGSCDGIHPASQSSFESESRIGCFQPFEKDGDIRVGEAGDEVGPRVRPIDGFGEGAELLEEELFVGIEGAVNENGAEEKCRCDGEQ